MIRCQCLAGHREHEYRAGQHGLCTVCAHGINAHKPALSETAERITRLLRYYDVGEFWVTTEDGGRRLRLDVELVAR